jgi:hypothetical protein
MAAIIQFRRDTAANWTSNDPTLAAGEIGYETDTEKYKIGDGSLAWTSLGYTTFGGISQTLIDAKGDLVVGTADNVVGRLAVGSNGQMLVADSSTTGGIAWASQESIVNWHEAVKLATSAVLPNTPSYDNGSSGVGATLTTSTQVRLQVDGANATTGDRVLVQDQATAAQNGIYDVTAQGASGSAVWLLTRADDFDGTPAGQVKSGESVYVLAGSNNDGQGFVVTSTSDPHTIGTHSIDFTQFTGTQAFTAGTGVSITGNTINVGTASSARIVTNADDLDLATTAVTAAAYGSATAVPGYTVDAYGRLTAAANTTIAVPSTAVTDFTEAVQDVSGAQLATNGTHTGITAAYDDAGDGAIDLALVTENVQDISGAQLATNGSHTGITATYDDAGDGAIDLALITENVQDIAGAQVATNGSHTGIGATYDDAGDGAIDLTLTASGVSAASYGSATQVPGYTVDTYGRLTAASNTTIAVPSTAVTDFTEAVQDVAGAQVVTNGSHTHLTATYDDAGDGAIDIALNTTAVTAAAYGSATQVPGYTVDAYGRLTAASNTTIAVPSTAVTDFTEAVQDVSGAQLATNGSHTGITATYDDAGDGAIDLALITENVQDISGAQLATNGTHTGITATYDDASDGAIDLVLITESVQDISGAQLATNGSHTGITATYDDAGDGAIDLALITENVQDITGAQIATNGTHVGLTAAYDDAGDGAVDLTVAATLGTHTSGNYIATVAGTANEVEVSGSGSETAAVTVGLPADVTVTTSLTTPLINVSGASIVLEGATADDFETTLTVTDPTADRTITFGNETGTVFTTASIQALADGVTATTQSGSNNTTKLATTAYVDAQATTAAAAITSFDDADGDTKIQVEESADEDIIRFDTAGTERMSIAADGTVTIVGNLVVSGTETTISSTTITVDDKNIELGSVGTPTDVTADGGGITLKGATDKTFNWVDSTDAWTSSEHVALATGKSVYIDGVIQLSKDALAATVVLADGVAGTTQSQSNNSTKVATTAYVDAGLGALSSDSLTDADADTKIQVEESADEDIIRFDTAGTERMTIGATGVVATVGALTAGGVLTASSGIADGATATTQSSSDNSTKLATTAYVDTGLGALSSDSITDADGDTKIQVEESADEDKIRFDIAGTEVAVLDGTALDVAGNVLYDIDIKEVNESSGTTYTLLIGDRGKLLRVGDEGNNTSANTVTIPTNANVPYPIGTQVQVVAMGGEVTMATAGTPTLRYTPGLKLRDRYSSCTCIKIATDEWVLVGDLEA